jgi:tRNA U34 5-methylaminomethyl-2-thiouridine-forming methyltransferase MnmC
LETGNLFQPLELLVTADGSHTLKSRRFNASYHSVNGAMDESNHVFITNGLLRRLNTKPQQSLHVLEIGFGTGLNAWLSLLKSKELGISIHYHAIEAFPVSPGQASLLNYCDQKDKELFMQLHSCAWHKEQAVTDRFYFTKYHQLLQGFESVYSFDIIYFDAFSPGEQPELWTKEVLKKICGLLNNDGILVTYCARGQVKRDLRSLGLNVKALPGASGKREMTVAEKLNETYKKS